MSVSDKNQDGQLDVTEFIKYLHEHEMKLRIAFKKLDKDKDGMHTLTEYRYQYVFSLLHKDRNLGNNGISYYTSSFYNIILIGFRKKLQNFCVIH